MRALICGGGTGGHIYPALAAVAELRRQGMLTTDFLWIGTRGEMEEDLVRRAGLQLETIRGGPVVGIPLPEMLMNAAKLSWSIGKTARLMRSFRPDVVFLTGGYVNVPVALVAWLRRTPAVIYLPDVEPGTAIRVLSRFAERVACTTPDSARFFPAGKTVVTGYPVRPAIREAATLSVEQALARFELSAERQTLLVFGGSRGARSINRAVMTHLLPLLARIQVIHITGILDWPEVSAFAESVPSDLRAFYRPYPYLHDEMGAAYRAADLVVARAGASMLGEIPAFGLPAVLIPYPHAWRYQRVNADYLAERGAALRLDDESLSEHLLSTVRDLLDNGEKIEEMSNAAKALDMPDASARVAHLLMGLGKGQMGNCHG